MGALREKLNPTWSSAVPSGGLACAVAAINAWIACVLLPGLPTRVTPLGLGLSTFGLVPALVAALHPPDGPTRSRLLRLGLGPLGLLAAVLALDVSVGLVLDPSRAVAAASSFVVYLALAAATKDTLPTVEVLREDPHPDRGHEAVGRRARRRALLFAALTAQAFSLIVVAPFSVAASVGAERWGAAAKEGRVFTLLFGLALALLVTLGILAPVQRRQREPERSEWTRFVLAAGLATVALGVVGLLGSGR